MRDVHASLSASTAPAHHDRSPTHDRSDAAPAPGLNKLSSFQQAHRPLLSNSSIPSARSGKTLMNLLPSIALATLLVAAHPGADAAVVVGGTRVVYPAESRDVSVRVTNNGEAPGLVQSWMDAGDPKARPEDLDVPFNITPAVYRLDPGKTQVMRMMFLGANLPKDRESLYWLNVLEIPPKPTAEGTDNYLQFAVRTRIKVFYRPKGLSGNVDSAPGGLKWAASRAPDGTLNLRVENPSAFHVSFAEVKLTSSSGALSEAKSGMVLPFDALQFSFKPAAADASRPARVQFKTVNDYGGFIDGAADLH